MSLYDVNYNNKAVELSPPDKRYSFGIAWIRTLLSSIQKVRDKWLGDYRIGSSYPVWIAGTYAAGARVTYKQRVYESLIDGNTSNPTSSDWFVFLPSFIGVNTRAKFNGHKLVLEYALNQYYFTTFRQPNLVSDIYIGLVPPEVVGFLVGQTIGSTVAESDIAGKTQWTIGSYAQYDVVFSEGELGLLRLYLSLINANTDEPPSANWHQTDTVGYSQTFVRLSNFTIFVPSAVYYSSLPFAPTIETEMRAIVDKLIPVGINYTITPY